jgi:hypothetical protein
MILNSIAPLSIADSSYGWETHKSDDYSDNLTVDMAMVSQSSARVSAPSDASGLEASFAGFCGSSGITKIRLSDVNTIWNR